ncbi:hypothetical protein [Pseudodesulfovibrio senegalensis]|uniref:Uncharacterized protein n=1 Tax=Pseudodesulfovibrio senegalensis TaxID=1721087 RepID=A0A6N6MZQ4_9BACT|nr:hypothetical protein [Pseudodesulfovibrio senegalensis]KAB1439093.1 hypothetical protein F8A88_14400 [Pseudodesulfovibrio senegalensis]
MTTHNVSMRVYGLYRTPISKGKSARRYALRLAGSSVGGNAAPILPARIVPVWSRALRLDEPGANRASDFVSLTTTARKRHV